MFVTGNHLTIDFLAKICEHLIKFKDQSRKYGKFLNNIQV